jgi:hypothetical protein
LRLTKVKHVEDQGVIGRDQRSEATGLLQRDRQLDTIHFNIRDSSEKIHGGGSDCREVAISINGRDLVEILTDIEMPCAVAEGSPTIAGGYLGLPPQDVVPPSRHFLGDPKWGVYKDIDLVSVLECSDCRMPGCWPFMVKITLEEDRVVWSDFRQPHQGPSNKASYWTYKEMKPFIFDRGQYMSALEKLSAEYVASSNDVHNG